jgi:membrane-bound metal-dependent hydrolase YbcI (DUF457 family)
VTHFLAGWSLAVVALPDARSRALATLAGVAPDLDGAGIVVDLATRSTSTPTNEWAAWHHVVGHGLLASVVVTFACAALAKVDRAKMAALAFASFHLHVLGDLVGARGPDGDQWPIRYLWPFADVELTWSGQWALNAWPNFAITGALLVVMFVAAWRVGRSPLEMVSARANDAFVATLRRRFGAPVTS